MRDRTRLRLRLRADGKNHSRENLAVDSPEEIRLVLPAIDAAIQLAVDHARVVSRRDESRVDRVRLAHEVAELRERVAAHARNRRTSARILGDEVVDDVVTESALEIQHIVRNAQRLTDASSVVDRIERTAGAIGDVVAIAEQLNRRADDIIALLDEQRSGDRGIHAARHRDEYALALHDDTACSRRALFTSFANT